MQQSNEGLAVGDARGIGGEARIIDQVWEVKCRAQVAPFLRHMDRHGDPARLRGKDLMRVMEAHGMAQARRIGPGRKIFRKARRLQRQRGCEERRVYVLALAGRFCDGHRGP